MHKSKLIIGIFICLCTLQMQAMINPGIWYRPDSLIVMPQEDSVLWTDEYTVFTVMRSTNNESECLWSFKGNDTVSVAVLTNGFYSSKTGIIRSNNARDFSKWCIFSYHSGIILDNNKQYKLSLGEQYVYTDSMAIDTLHSQIEMEEFAYFKGNVPKLTAHTFQSYLALKYGITLDYAPYISQSGDTLWHPVYDAEYYHRVMGVGHDTILNWFYLVSHSKEDSLLYIQSDTLLPNEYVLFGDNDAPLYWQKDFDNDYILQREWRLRRFTSQPNNIMVVLQLAAFDESVDSIQMILKTNGTEQLVTPDSISLDNQCYFTINTTDTIIHFQFKGKIVNENSFNFDKSKQAQNNANADIFYDPISQTIVIDGFPNNQEFILYLYDNLGRYITTISGLNPINVHTFPNTVSYVEIIVGNHIIGVLTLPMKIR